MTHKNLLLIASLCSVAFLTSGCTTCPTGTYNHHKHGEHPEHMAHKNKHKKHEGPKVFHQKYEGDDIKSVHGKMMTRSNNGRTAVMGFIEFLETNDGLQMNVDLVYLRPNQVYTAQIYQCGTCNDSVCCDTAAMNIDLPTIQTNQDERLQQSYIIRGLSASQLNNAKLILTRDGGYKAAWGTLKQK